MITEALDSRRVESPPIDLEDAVAVRDWAKRYGVTERALRRAIERVGADARDVERELGGRR